MFVRSFKIADVDPTRNSFDEYQMQLVKIKDFNPLIDQQVKNKQKTYEKVIEMSRNDEYTTANLSVYLHHKNIINSFA